jgi:hypothetical protein
LVKQLSLIYFLLTSCFSFFVSHHL